MAIPKTGEQLTSHPTSWKNKTCLLVASRQMHAGNALCSDRKVEETSVKRVQPQSDQTQPFMRPLTETTGERLHLAKASPASPLPGWTFCLSREITQEPKNDALTTIVAMGRYDLSYAKCVLHPGIPRKLEGTLPVSTERCGCTEGDHIPDSTFALNHT